MLNRETQLNDAIYDSTIIMPVFLCRIMNIEQIIPLMLAVICCKLVAVAAAPVNQRSKRDRDAMAQAAQIHYRPVFSLVLNDEITERRFLLQGTFLHLVANHGTSIFQSSQNVSMWKILITM